MFKNRNTKQQRTTYTTLLSILGFFFIYEFSIKALILCFFKIGGHFINIILITSEFLIEHRTNLIHNLKVTQRIIIDKSLGIARHCTEYSEHIAVRQ